MVEVALTHRAIEEIARKAYGRLLAILAKTTGDLTRAEDALGDALARALDTWPNTGIPTHPEAWLITTARRRVIDLSRQAGTAARAAAEVAAIELHRLDERGATQQPPSDPRLELLCVCAHPAIDQSIHTPLMMQTVLGLTVKDIAALFVEPASALNQRLARAKRKIKAARIAFTRPDAAEIESRLPLVLAAIYGALAAAAGRKDRALLHEAVWLADICASLLPNEAEAQGLLALSLYTLARGDAVGDASTFIPLASQDPSDWDTDFLDAAEAALHRAGRHRQPGRYQLEAAIQSATLDEFRRGKDNTAALERLYQALLARSPTLGASVDYAAFLRARGAPDHALKVLSEVETLGQPYLPWWVARAEVAKDHGDDPAPFLRRARDLSTRADLDAHLSAQLA